MTARTLDRRIVLLLALACGAAAANLYYAQPLLNVIARQLHVSSGTAGLLLTASQLGYAIGLATLVPLGDILERRRLVTRLLALNAITLIFAAVAPSFSVLLVALVVVGTTSAVAQVLVPLAASLAGDQERGKIVGTVMSGLLIGILLARTVSGVIAEIGGWRLMYWIAAGLIALLAILVRRTLPTTTPESERPYGSLLRSIGTLLVQEPILRRRIAYGAMGMASFSVLWTALTFLLADAPYGYSEARIGLFGLIGVVGAASAQLAGRIADRGGLHAATGAFMVAVLAGWAFLFLARESLAAIIVGILLIDLGLQGQHISNQHAIYARRPEARSRMTTAYITFNFLMGAVASAAAAFAYAHGGWTAVAILGTTLATVAVLTWCQEQFARRRSAVPEPIAG